jgi:hypothetical protein
MRTVLDAVCESIGCSWSVVPSTSSTPARLQIFPLADRSAQKALGLKEPIDLKVKAADVRQVLQTFGQILSVGVDLNPWITGKVSLELDNVPCGEAIDKTCAAAGCAWKLDTSGKTPILRFTVKK